MQWSRNLATHNLRLEFGGLRAGADSLPPSQAVRVISGAREFLGAHAYYLTEGKIPQYVQERGKHFSIECSARGGLEWKFQIVVDPRAHDFLQRRVGQLRFRPGVAMSRNEGLAYFIRHSFSEWRGRRPLGGGIFDWAHPRLTSSSNEQPFVDWDRDDERNREQLFSRIDGSVERMTAPIRKSATSLEMWLDEELLGGFEVRFLEADITQALLALPRLD